MNVKTIIDIRAAESENLKVLAERYPDAVYVVDQLYEVKRFREEDQPSDIWIENNHVWPCVVIGHPISLGRILVRESTYRAVALEHVAHRIMDRDPQAVLEALR